MQALLNEYQPKGPTEKQLVQDLADTAWRINRIPLLEADLFAQVHSPHESASPQPPARDMRRAAALQEMHKKKGVPYEPALDGFVFSIEEIQAFIDRTKRRNQAGSMEYALHCGHA